MKIEEKSSIQLVLFDFDGTLIKGDSTKLAYRTLYRSKLSFILSYYLRHLVSLLVLLLTAKEDSLRESRRVVLASKFDKINKLEFINQSQSRLFDSVLSEAKNYSDNGYILIINSAGYSEIIRLIIGENLDYQLIANSLFDKKPEAINFENKVVGLNLKVKSTYFVKAAYGNSEGDIPMLRVAEKAFWVDENGKISEFVR